VPWPRCSRSTPIQCCNGWSQPPAHLRAFSEYFLHDVCVTQVQLDELYVLLCAVREGKVSEALQRLSRSPHWVWAAIDPVSMLLLTIEVGERTRAWCG
jgi:hypothetical protein